MPPHLAQSPMDELRGFLEKTNGPASINPNNPFSDQAAPSANKANPAFNPSMPGAFNNPANPALNPSLPGATNNPANPAFNPAMPGAMNNPSNPQFNPAMPGAMNNPANPQLNPNNPNSFTNPSNPIHNPDYPAPDAIGQAPTNLPPNASFPPARQARLRARYGELLQAPGHQLWFRPRPRGEAWGRGLIHLPTQTVHTWPEGEAEHNQMLQAKGYEDPDTVRFVLSPQGAVQRLYGPDWGQSQVSPGDYQRMIYEADPSLARANGWRQADNATQDTREWPDPTEPRASKPPAQQGCTCAEDHKLDCPIHGMEATAPDLDHTWALPENQAVGYPQDQPRGWVDAVHSSVEPKEVVVPDPMAQVHAATVAQLAETQQALMTLVASMKATKPEPPQVEPERRPRKLVIQRDSAGRMASIEEVSAT